MIIDTPNPEGGEPIRKQIVVGGGVTFKVEGWRYSMLGTVTDLNEGKDEVRVQGTGFEGWVPRRMVIDASSVEQNTFQEIYNNNVSETHRVSAEDAYKGV